MDRLPAELLLAIAEGAAGLGKPVCDKDTPVLLTPVLQTLKALRLTCKLFAENVIIKDRLFEKITISMHPKRLKKARDTDLSRVSSHVRELRFIPQHFTGPHNQNFGGQHLSLQNYYHILRLQCIWEHAKQCDASLPSDFARANAYIEGPMGGKLPWSFAEVRQGHAAFQKYREKVDVNLRTDKFSNWHRTFITQFPNLRHVNFSSGLDLQVNPVKSLPRDILVSESWLDEIPRDLPVWCHSTLLKFINVNATFHLIGVTAEHITRRGIALEELTVACYIGDAHIHWALDHIRALRLDKLTRLNFSPLTFPGIYTTDLSQLLLVILLKAAQPTIQILSLTPRYCPDYTFQRSIFTFYGSRFTQGFPRLKVLELQDLAMTFGSREAYADAFWSKLPALETIKGRGIKWQDFGGVKSWRIMDEHLKKRVDLSSVEYPEDWNVATKLIHGSVNHLTTHDFA